MVSFDDSDNDFVPEQVPIKPSCPTLVRIGWMLDFPGVAGNRANRTALNCVLVAHFAPPFSAVR